MSTLIVTLNPPAQSSLELDWCLASNSHTITRHGSATAALLPRADDTVLLLPNAAVSWHLANLPKLARSLSGSKMRAVLDGLVEEQLLDDISDLHIALFRHAASSTNAVNAVWLAVCNKAWLTAQIQQIQGAGHRLSRIAAQSYPIAISPDSEDEDDIVDMRVHVGGRFETAMMTVSDTTGVLSTPLAYARTVWPDLPYYELHITAEPAVAAAAEAVLGCKVAVVQGAQLALQATLDARSMGLDLAQGDMVVAGSGRWLQKVSAAARDLLSAPAWGTARWGAALLILANLVGLNAWAWKERSSLEAKRSQTTQILTQTFPQVKVIVDAPLQMGRELASLRQASGGLGSRDMENLFARFAALAPAAAPISIEFNAGELFLKGSGVTSAQLAQMQPQLRSAGLLVRSEGERLIVAEAPTTRTGDAP
jgi:general secretion pathway protein L